MEKKKKKKGKTGSVYVCSNCGYYDGQWWGTCKKCEEVGMVKRFTSEGKDQKVTRMQVSGSAARSWLPREAAPVKHPRTFGRFDHYFVLLNLIA